MQQTYRLQNETVDSVLLKCMVVSRGVNVDKAVYDRFCATTRLNPSPLCCNCMYLPDNTIVQLTDMRGYADGFDLAVEGEQAVLRYRGKTVTPVTFPPRTAFYRHSTPDGTPVAGNAVLQGCDFVAFQCLWPCEYAAAGKKCAFCFSGDDFFALHTQNKPLPPPLSADNLCDITRFAIEDAHVNSMQITGGSTFDAAKEARYITGYLRALQSEGLREKLTGELLLYITPPADTGLLDDYFALGASRIACSVEVWDETLAKQITPGKTEITTRERHLQALTYIAEHYGKGKAFSNLIIGLEGIDSLTAGATYLAQRGIVPSASVWMPMGKHIEGVSLPDLDFYRRAVDVLAEVYTAYGLEPAGRCGLNVCIERDIWRTRV